LCRDFLALLQIKSLKLEQALKIYLKQESFKARRKILFFAVLYLLSVILKELQTALANKIAD